MSYPLLLINWAPSGSPIDLMTLHASSLSHFQQTAEVAKVSFKSICVLME